MLNFILDYLVGVGTIYLMIVSTVYITSIGICLYSRENILIGVKATTEILRENLNQIILPASILIYILSQYN